MIALLGALATAYGIGAGLSSLLQARRMHQRGASADVSLGFLGSYIGGYAIWLTYGLGIGSTPLIVVDAVGLVCGGITLIVAFRLRSATPSATDSRGGLLASAGVPASSQHRRLHALSRRAAWRTDGRSVVPRHPRVATSVATIGRSRSARLHSAAPSDSLKRVSQCAPDRI
jgi:uncharacterized protein with PQ loop repeat